MDGAIIYVAGNPELYPVEYYDPDSQSYQGALPEFLAGFAQAYGYDLRYLQPGAEDRRIELAENQQVDVISGCEAKERYAHTSGGPVLLFSGGTEGEETVYALFLTQTAPSRVQADLREYAARTTQVQWTGALLEAAGEAPTPARPAGVLAGAGVGMRAVLIGLVVSLICLRREKRRKVRQEQTDPKTGLGTAAALEEGFSRVSRDQSRRFYSLVCLHLELDRVGQLWGYERAEELLRRGVLALQQSAEAGDLLARSGEELLILKRAPSPQEAAQWADGVVKALRADMDGLRAQDAAAGIYPLELEFSEFDRALFHARQCAQAACREGERSRLCGAERCEECRARWKLLEDFSRALEQDEFQLYLQFFVDAGTARIVGGEALSRWYHPGFGFLSPDRYIPLLEEAGRLEELDLHGLEKTCALLEELDRHEIRDFFISCNFSRTTFCAPDFASRCIQTVQRYAFQRKLLILEVTESQRIEPFETEQLRQNIQALRQSGMRVIFDDFGTGFSSFRDLQNYPMDGLKLDKELVDNMQTETGRLILHALVDTGHRMGLTILAEGVENEEQIEALRRLHCDAFQGFRFSVPLPEAQVRRRILQGDRALGGQRAEGEVAEP